MSDQIRIEKVRKRGGDYILAITNKDEPLTVTAELYYRHRLKEGIVITPAQLAQLEQESEMAMCMREVNRLLALREHSTSEIRTKLSRKKFDSELVRIVLGKFTRNGLLDDARFAQSLARRTIERKPAGRSYLLAVLQRKGIERALAERVVDNLLSTNSESETATAALKKKWQSLQQFDVETARSKAYNYLSRRGFGYDAARTAFETLQQRTEEVGENQDG